MTPEAYAHLRKQCPAMRRLITAHGPCGLEVETGWTPFQALVSAVAHQQLHGKAAATILKRFRTLYGGRFPSAQRLATEDDDALRACGFSRSKIAALRDIAAKSIDGTVPGSRLIKTLPDEEIIARLTAVRGVGRWTAQMLLIFKLGRPDVLPADDFGVRAGFQVAFRLDAMPSAKVVIEYGERWRPHGTTAAWYLWRAADAAKNPLG